MIEKSYLSRLCDTELQLALQSSGAVLIEGAKWCGKTSTASNVSSSVLYMQDPDSAVANKALADTKPSLLLKGETPRLIDEWQVTPVLWDAIRFEVDKRAELGQFILTGSAVPVDNVTAHTGTGRISRILMRPMSLFESLESNGTVSLRALFAGNLDVASISDLSIEQIAFVLCRGGWPASIGVKDTSALRMARDYVETVINYDISRVDEVEKNPDRVRLLMRSKTAIRTSAKRHFVDPSIATAVMRTSPEGILKDFEYFGFLFEALCTRDIRIYAQANDGDVFHYKDKSGLEADLIIRLRDGRWAAIEVKLDNKQIELAAENLLKIKAHIDEDKMGEASFLMVITGGQYAYLRKDGVLVVPIGCLRD